MVTINQRDVDIFLQQDKKLIGNKRDLSKEIDPITLEKIIKMVESISSKGFNAEQAGGKIGVSRTTSK